MVSLHSYPYNWHKSCSRPSGRFFFCPTSHKGKNRGEDDEGQNRRLSYGNAICVVGGGVFKRMGFPLLYLAVVSLCGHRFTDVGVGFHRGRSDDPLYIYRIGLLGQKQLRINNGLFFGSLSSDSSSLVVGCSNRGESVCGAVVAEALRFLVGLDR